MRRDWTSPCSAETFVGLEEDVSYADSYETPYVYK